MSSEVISQEVVDGVAVIEWHEHRPGDAAVGNQVAELLARDDVDAYVAVDRTDQYLSPETQEAIGRMAAVAADGGIERVALVGEAIKALAARQSFEQQGMEVYTTEDRDDGVEWARNDE